MPKKLRLTTRSIDRQQAEQAEIEDQLLGERERDRGEPAVEVAPVMLDVDPVERLEVEGAVRGVVPDLGQDRGRRSGRREERRRAGVPEDSRGAGRPARITAWIGA